MACPAEPGPDARLTDLASRAQRVVGFPGRRGVGLHSSIAMLGEGNHVALPPNVRLVGQDRVIALAETKPGVTGWETGVLAIPLSGNVSPGGVRRTGCAASSRGHCMEPICVVLRR